MKRKTKKRIITVLMLVFAGIINATGITLFLAPVNLFDSGISGTSMLLSSVTPDFFNLTFFLIVLNVPFYIFAVKKQGAKFVVYSLIGIISYSVFSFLYQNAFGIDFSNGSPFTAQDMLLSGIFGGLLSGIGSGLVIRFGGAIDGIEVMAVLFAKKIGLTVGTFIMIYNVALYVVGAIVYGSWLIPLYSIIAYMIGVKTIDFIVEGLDKAKAVYIVTDKENELVGILCEKLGRGVTVWEVTGYYSNDSKSMIYCVVNRFEIPMVKSIVEDYDGEAFVTINDISETIGSRNLKFSIFKKKK